MDANEAVARQAVSDAMAHQHLTDTALAERAGVDFKTVQSLLSGKRWPQRPSRAKISEALGFDAAWIDEIVRTGAVPSLGDALEEGDDQLLYRRPDGMTEGEWERIRRGTDEYHRWLIAQATQER